MEEEASVAAVADTTLPAAAAEDMEVEEDIAAAEADTQAVKVVTLEAAAARDTLAAAEVSRNALLILGPELITHRLPRWRRYSNNSTPSLQQKLTQSQATKAAVAAHRGAEGRVVRPRNLMMHELC